MPHNGGGNPTTPTAEATLSNWDGHFEVEQTASALSRLNVEQYNGYASIAKCSRPLMRCGSDVDDDATDSTNTDSCKGGTDAELPFDVIDKATLSSTEAVNRQLSVGGYYSSPNRSSIVSGTGGALAGGADSSRHASLRLGASSRLTTMGSSLLGDSMTEIILEDLPQEHEPTSALLDYCKRKFLKPYVMILSLVGLNPIATDTSLCRACLSYLQAALLLLLLLFGYFLQYLTSYRGDRGFSNYRKTVAISSPDLRASTVRTVGELLFGYVIPNTLHLCGYISAVIVCKIVDNEQLQNLIERVFLMSMKPRRLCRILWLYVALGFAFLSLLFAYVMPSVLMQTQIVTQLQWMSDTVHTWQLTTKLTFLCTIFVQDLVEIVILTSYCIECYLLRVHLATLSHKLLMHSIESLDWMREVLEFRKLLDHLNQRVAVPVCFFTVMNLSYAFAGLVYLFNDFDFHFSAIKVVVLNIINVLLWLVMGLMPFFMAASLTRGCQTAQANGHQIRVRPFVYHNTSAEDLNSTLLFATSLDMSAKLFRMPILPNYVCFAILVISVVILTLGMCFNLSALGSV